MSPEAIRTEQEVKDIQEQAQQQQQAQVLQQFAQQLQGQGEQPQTPPA